MDVASDPFFTVALVRRNAARQEPAPGKMQHWPSFTTVITRYENRIAARSSNQLYR
jgi:hypothetical protein